MKKYLVLGALVVAACVPPADERDAGVHDAGFSDAGSLDSGVVDAGVVDAGELDAGVVDAGELDGGAIDSGTPDAGIDDAGVLDAGCEPGETRACYPGAPGTLGVGPCVAGSQTCTADAGWDLCLGAVEPATETCDDIDNDCDGDVDEGTDTVWCDTGLPGNCAPGLLTCDGPSGQLLCIQNFEAHAEWCNGSDDDCDGLVDEDNPGGGQWCMTGLPGLCNAGTTSCDGGVISCLQTTQPTPEICDDLDNDCDGYGDENNPGGGAPCSTGLLGNCAAGTITCLPTGLSCVQNQQAVAERCDGHDNDCDGVVDEGSPDAGVTCSTGLLGVCAAGTTSCSGGQLLCQQTTQSSAELCDNLDNNCNGVKDEGVCDGGM